MWVVKLGGSLAAGDQLVKWVESVEETPVVVVPGGGPFADAVRDQQKRWKFSDHTAHHMALLAMEQYGRMLCDLSSSLIPAGSLKEIKAVLQQGKAPVWMPVEMVLGAEDVQKSWEVTSDSLAAWLCGRLQGRGLVLVKSVSEKAISRQLSNQANTDLVDSAFDYFCGLMKGVDVHVISANGWKRLNKLLMVRQRSQAVEKDK